MNELALFAGAGGGILGGKLLGWRTVCAVEFAAYPRSVLLARQRDGILEPFPIWDDVRTFDGKPWRGRVDVISGGFPCQDISSAGCSWKTRQFSLQGGLESFSGTWPAWGIMLDGECWETDMYQTTIRAGAFGLPRRPNAADGPKFYVVGKESAILRAANPERQLMLIHKIGLLAYGHLKKWWANPPFWEAAMGWPVRWTDLNPLETARFQQWLNSHGKH